MSRNAPSYTAGYPQVNMPLSANTPTLAHDLATETWDRTITQDTCPFFSRLSVEVRTKIFEFAVTAYDDKSKPYSETAYYNQPGYRCHQRISTTLLLTCRRIYFETYLLPAKCNEVVEWFFRGPPGSPVALTNRLTISPEQLAVTPCVHLFVQQYWLESQWIDLTSSHLRTLKPRILHLTLRHSDWWCWESRAKLCLDPKLQGRVYDRSITSEASDDFVEGSWGNGFRRLRGLREFKLELETTTIKKDELNAIVARAPSWQFPLGDGNVLILDESKTTTTTWIGRRDYREDSTLGGLMHRCRGQYQRVLIVRLRLVKVNIILGSLPPRSLPWHPQSVHPYPQLNSNIPHSTQNSRPTATGSTPGSQTNRHSYDTFTVLRQAGIDPNQLSASQNASAVAPSPYLQNVSVENPLRSFGLPRNDNTSQSTLFQGHLNQRARALREQQQIGGASTSLNNAVMSARQMDIQGNPTPYYLSPTDFQQQLRALDHYQMLLDNLAEENRQAQQMQHIQQPVVSTLRGPNSTQQQATRSNLNSNFPQQSRPLPPTVHPRSTYHAGQTYSTPRPDPLPPLNASQYAPPFSGGPLPHLATPNMGLHSVVEDPTQEYYVVTLRWFSRTAA